MSGGTSRRCKNCHKVFYDPIHKKAKKFCSRTCNCNYANRKYQIRMKESYKLIRSFHTNSNTDITVQHLAETTGIPESTISSNVRVLKQMTENMK